MIQLSPYQQMAIEQFLIDNKFYDTNSNVYCCFDMLQSVNTKMVDAP